MGGLNMAFALDMEAGAVARRRVSNCAAPAGPQQKKVQIRETQHELAYARLRVAVCRCRAAFSAACFRSLAPSPSHSESGGQAHLKARSR